MREDPEDRLVLQEKNSIVEDEISRFSIEAS